MGSGVHRAHLRGPRRHTGRRRGTLRAHRTYPQVPQTADPRRVPHAGLPGRHRRGDASRQLRSRRLRAQHRNRRAATEARPGPARWVRAIAERPEARQNDGAGRPGHQDEHHARAGRDG